ncbi:hypothetical protein ACYBSK_27545 [Streptomyces sp. BYX5S]
MTNDPGPEIRPETPGGRPPAIPRDLPDQEAGAHEVDPLDVPVEKDEGDNDTSVPDSDEAGTGRRGAPHTNGTRADQPTPDEPSG